MGTEAQLEDVPKERGLRSRVFSIKKTREDEGTAGRDVGSSVRTGRTDPGKRENTGKCRGERTNAK